VHPGVTKERMKLTAQAIKENPYIPIVPTIKQLEWLAAPQAEKGYGGAAGGGKSIALLAECLLPVKHRGYSGLILRRTYPELAMADAIMDVALQWLKPHRDVRWNENRKRFTFERFGSTLEFGFMEKESHKYRYQSAQFQRIAFDEATQFPWSQYSYMQSRARRPKILRVIPKLVSATNPGNIGHQWYYQWFVHGDKRERAFIQALLQDNPYLNAEEYKRRLANMTEIERRQLLGGEWIIDERGKPFKMSWWDGKNRYLPGFSLGETYARYMFVDSAIKDRKENAKNAIVVIDLMMNLRARVTWGYAEHIDMPTFVAEIKDRAHDFNRDGTLALCVIEDKANGANIYQTIRDAGDPLLSSRMQLFVPGPNWSKEQKWHQAGLWCGLNCVELPYATESVARWLFPFEEEIYAVPKSEFKDQADAFSLGVLFLEHLLAQGYHTREALGVA
jgi:hypothetical protein